MLWIPLSPSWCPTTQSVSSRAATNTTCTAAGCSTTRVSARLAGWGLQLGVSPDPLSVPPLSYSAHGGRQRGAALPERPQPVAAGAAGGAAVVNKDCAAQHVCPWGRGFREGRGVLMMAL